ncbi:MAG TPA: zinc-ribbon domain-containing protein [Thermoanaerobaculia bacterium]|nr:zinc-ribbon domain-containing protein [Thermoanaerobaculia bacterium]
MARRRSLSVTRRHSLFGEVPLLPGPDASGTSGPARTYDPDYRPDLPAGAVRGDPRRQLFCCEVPRYFYVDADRTCRDCGAPFVFSAREQKHWYETLGFRLDANAVRCLPCRRAFRRGKGIARALSDASRALTEAPLHPPAALAYARAAVAHTERFGHAPLDAAIAALRALRRHSLSVVETIYLEGRCAEAAGRPRRAAASYERFLAAAPPRGNAALARDARARLERLAASGS